MDITTAPLAVRVWTALQRCWKENKIRTEKRKWEEQNAQNLLFQFYTIYGNIVTMITTLRLHRRKHVEIVDTTKTRCVREK